MTRATISKRLQFRWGILHVRSLIDGGSRTMRHHGYVVGWRTGRHGWLIMPLQHLAEYRRSGEAAHDGGSRRDER
jgi:hypothetical protein